MKVIRALPSTIKLKMPALILLLVFFLFSLGGCSRWLDFGRTSKRYSDLPVFSSHPVHNYPNYSAGRFKISFLAEQITRVLKNKNIKETPLLILPIQELGRSNVISFFGRYFSEQLKTELYLNDFRVLRMGQEMEEQLMIQVGGNSNRFLSSPRRNHLINKLSPYGVASVICGSYQVGADNIYVNVQMVSLENLEIISIGSCELKKSENIMGLIKKKKIVKRSEHLEDKDQTTQNLLEFAVKGRRITDGKYIGTP